MHHVVIIINPNNMTHKINLKQGAVKFLRDMLSGTGWAKNVSDIILGGGLLVEKVPEVVDAPSLPNGPSAASSPALREQVFSWSKTAVPEFEITEKEREACRRCIKHFADQGAIPPTAAAAELLLAFGYTVE